MVTPYILEYKDDKPWVQVLWLLPIHQMIGRVKDQAHWQSDVIAGALVGYASGYWAHNRKTPMMLYFDDDKVVVGLKYKF
ncbi:MAG: phosphatase PAP2 family protein, partial [Arcobacteraceae bacterium]|nr:phosphatase PAP2 family protein [Arcobacteraceae bacterium]